ncbi:DUF4268 domain-containing protein [Parvicella tangerina]|uniref:DUF4268 domain-containing protein n=1 Tax=Parvicella tangerina TaxID=2829795 RepID=A0A916NTL0_9FLAO|nr:DUF4268 domain-containing protein [Parvicella tangerina]CAG5086014.1 hypothetical protein CRYO30217_02977 [Parvicella tangerina]
MDLGQIEKVDLRKAWKHEALNFTKWLAKEENIVILADELDIEIENVKPEESAGRYSVDILADDLNTRRKIIIENQLEATDHKHLGQLLTYASAHDASIIIWVVKDYTEEHKQAIDWFNKHMPEEISFFLVQIELWKIGNSLPAPKFNIISQPNNWAKTIKKAASQEKGNPSELKLLQQRFWGEMKDYLNNSENSYNISFGRTPRPQHWYDVSIGTAKANISFSFNSKQSLISCELYIKNDAQIFDRIIKDEAKIKSVLGDDLQFLELPDKAAFRIIRSLACDPFDENKWPQYFEWLITNGEKFQKTFKKYF